jgi:hypothetical protein
MLAAETKTLDKTGSRPKNRRTVQLGKLLLNAIVVCLLVAPGGYAGLCDAPPEWFPSTGGTPAPDNHNPNSPDVDCPFYQAAWQHFLFVTQPGPDGSPSFFGYKDIADLFGPAAASNFATGPSGRTLRLGLRVAERPHTGPKAGLKFVGSSVTGPDVFQAGVRGLLIDQKGHPVFYGINVNPDFDSFLSTSNLKTPARLLVADKDTQFSKGSMELKSAWQIVDDANPPKNYIIAKASVPMLKVQNGLVVPQQPRTVTVALLALHVVFVLDGHPEFIWSTFEHVNDGGDPDLAPSATMNPAQTPPTTVISSQDFTLYRKNTPASVANTPVLTQTTTAQFNFDETTQTFTEIGGAPLQTSVYRAFPGSKSDSTDVDDEVKAINTSVRSAIGASDPRRNYRLTGAVWLQHPDISFTLSDNPFPDAALQGENRLSGLAMESFTQDQNCFACHNTAAVVDDVTSVTIVASKKLNVSHVLSKYLASKPPVFADVEEILTFALSAFSLRTGRSPNLSAHGTTWDPQKGAWATKGDLLKADGHGKGLLIQNGCGPGKGSTSNLVVDLSKGLPLQMPKGGPFLDAPTIKRISDWIDAGCPD